jgi:dGTPase
MEDVLTASDQELRHIKCAEDVRNRLAYTITFSAEIQQEVTEIWRRIQAGILHRNERVVSANLRAARIVSDLLILYAIAPELVDPRFRKSHEGLASTDYIKWYHDKLGATVGISSSRLNRYFYDHVIGRELKKQGDNYLLPTIDLVLAKDYVASLTNGMAEREHRHLFGSVTM